MGGVAELKRISQFILLNIYLILGIMKRQGHLIG